MRGGVMSLTGRGEIQTKEQTESQNERENTNSRAWPVLLETGADQRSLNYERSWTLKSIQLMKNHLKAKSAKQ